MGVGIDTVYEIINKLLPSVVAIGCEQVGDFTDKLSDDERSYIDDAVTSRKMEFSTGRFCARKALGRIGVPSASIPVGDMREPIWPLNTIGSITHAGNWCVAVVLIKGRILSIGIDIAEAQSLDQGIVDLICTEDDKLHTRIIEVSSGIDPYALIFSIKESVYKCLFPIVKEIFDFQDVSICLDLESGIADVKLENRKIFDNFGYTLESRFCKCEGNWFSVVWAVLKR